MGVHHPPAYFHQFSDVSNQERSPKTQLSANIQRIPDEIGGLNTDGVIHAQTFAYKIRSVIPRCKQSVLGTALPSLTKLYPNRVHQRFFAHRLHNSGGSQNGNPVHNSQPGVKGFARESFPIRHRNHNIQSSGVIGQPHHFQKILLNHSPGNRIDGGISYRLVQARFGYPTDTCPSLNEHSRLLRAGYFRIDQRSVCNIRVISTVLLNGAGHPLLCHCDVQNRKFQNHTFGGKNRNPLLALSRQQHPGRCFRRCGCTASRCITKTKLLSVLFNECFQYTHRII